MLVNDQDNIQTIEQIAGLLHQKAKGALCAEDQLMLDNWLNRQSHDDRQYFENITRVEEIEKALRFMYSIDEVAALVDVFKTIRPESAKEVAVSKRRIIKTVFFKYSVAVIFAGAIIIISLFLLTRNRTNVAIGRLPVNKRYLNEVLPGGEKATLQLADGSYVILNSAQNGKISDQGGTAVNKQDGMVLYNSSATNSSGTTSVYYNTLVTPAGGQYQVLLPDGTRVWLNARSTLRFPASFTGNERLVELTGEAYFEVAKKLQMPFRVKIRTATGTNTGQIEVLGTHFNINAYDDEEDIRATLLEGKVKVTSADGENATLRPGEQVSILRNAQLSQPFSIEPDEFIAWKDGLFRFQYASIESIMRQVARWYDVEVIYEKKLDKQFFGTIPRNVPLSTLLKILESTGWVHFMIDGKKITVAP